MIHLFYAELQKVWKNRVFLFSFFILLCVNVFLLWLNTETNTTLPPPSAYQKLNQQRESSSMEKLVPQLQQALETAEGLNRLDYVFELESYMGGMVYTEMRQEYAEDFKKYYESYKQLKDTLQYGNTIKQEIAFINQVLEEFEQVANYEQFLDSIDQKAKDLASISIFAKGGYAIDNINKTVQDYQTMRGTVISYYPQKGLVKALSFSLTDILLVFGMILISTALVRMERDSNLLALIRSTPSGRGKTAVAKLLAFAISMLVLVFGLYGMNLLYCEIMYGLGSLQRTIQSVPDFMNSTWKLTVAQYIIWFLVVKWIAAFICGVWVMLAMLLAKRLFTGVLAALGFLLACFLVRVIVSAVGKWNVVKYANPISLLNTNELLGQYQNLYWFGKPIPLLLVESVAAILFVVVFIGAFIWVFQFHIFKEAQKLKLWKWKSRMVYTTAFRQEGYKLLVLQGVAIFLFLFVVFQIRSANSIRPPTSIEEMYYQIYMSRIEGTITQEKLDWLREKDKEFEPIYQLGRDFKNGVITRKQYSIAMDSYTVLQQKMNIFHNVIQRLQSLPEAERPRTQLVYETGWLRLFDIKDSQSLTETLLISLLTPLCFAGFFAMEKQTGMIKVISCTPLGREKTVQYKLVWTTIICGIIAFFSVFPRLFVVLRYDGLGAWFAPVYSIAEYAKAPEIPLFAMMLLLFFSRFVAVVCIAFVTLVLSEKIGNGFATMFLSVLLFSIPILLSMVGVVSAKWISLYPVVHSTAILAEKNGAIMVIMLLVMEIGVCYCCYTYLMQHFGYIKKRT